MENSEVPPPFKVWNSVPMILQLSSRVSHITAENVDLIQDSYLLCVENIQSFNEHGPAERLTAPGSRVGFAERDAS